MLCRVLLQVEAMRQRTGNSHAFTSLTAPAIDWVALAAGMGVPAGRAESVDEMAAMIEKGLQTRGPFLIHAALA